MPLIGLKDLYVATIDATNAYAAPVRLAKAIEASITPNVSTVTLYADDGAAETASSIGNIEVTLNVDDLSSDSYALIMGKTPNADGVIMEGSEDSPPYLALGFRSLKSNGAYRYVWLYKGRFQLSEEAYKTKGEEVEFQTPSVSATFVANEDGQWRARVDSDDTGVNQTVIESWFTAVYTGPAPTV